MSGNKKTKHKTQNANQQTKGVQKYCNKGLGLKNKEHQKVSGSKKKNKQPSRY